MFLEKKCHFFMIPVIVIISVCLVYTHCYADWQTDLSDQFDFVETFDGIKDWRGTKTGDVYTIADMPTRLDGSPTKFGYYSYWASYPSLQDWIGFHGLVNTWRGEGKSLCIDISTDGTNQGGPSRLNIYFGDGTADSGYSDLYLFYMVKISSNQWPTSIVGGIGEYDQNATQFAYFESWKFGTFNLGCIGQDCMGDGGANYSSYHVIPHIKNGGSLNNNLQPTIRLEPNDDGNRQGIWGDGQYPFIRDNWTGVEFHLKNVNEDGVLFTYFDVWLYDHNGNATQVIKNYKYAYSSQPKSDKWNSFFFGGNNSNTYSWGDTLDEPYYVDDLIIDDSRIGPTYFSLLTDNPIPQDNKPKKTKGTAVVK